MKIKIIAIGKNMPTWVEAGYNDYSKRLSATFKLELIELPLLKRHKNADIQKLKDQEGEHILKAVSAEELLIALDEHGRLYTTHELSQQLQKWYDNSQNLCLCIGGPDGLSTKVLQKAQFSWSLSPLTLPHPLVRLLLAEQLYRSWSIITGHPYHRV